MDSLACYNYENKDARGVLASGRMIKTLGGVSMKNSISGIYAIVNRVNGNRYIGSSQDVYSRWARHVARLNANNHHSRHLQNAWNKYGAEVFDFIVLETCRNENLIKIEQKYIDAEKPLYNVSPTAGRTAGIIRSDEYREKQSKAQKGKVISEETRRKISEGMKGIRNSLGVSHSFSDAIKEQIRNKLLGHSVSEEIRKKISSKNKGYKHTDEAKKKIGIASLGNKHASRKMSDEEKKKRSDGYWKRIADLEENARSRN